MDADMDTISTTGLDVDIILHLFGDISLTDLTIGLDGVIDDILWKLKEPLGGALHTVRKSQEPAKALIYVLYERRRDEVLRGAFRDYILGDRTLSYLLVHGRSRGST
jgi:hypothetical protein